MFLLLCIMAASFLTELSLKRNRKSVTCVMHYTFDPVLCHISCSSSVVLVRNVVVTFGKISVMGR